MAGFTILFYLLILTAILILANPRVYFLITAGVLGLMAIGYVFLNVIHFFALSTPSRETVTPGWYGPY